MPNQILDSLAYQRSLAVRDLTDAALGPHAMQLIVQHSIEALCRDWQCPIIVYRASPVVSIAENYDDLRYPSDGASRDARYTRYVSSELLLRTQTSAMISRALHVVAGAAYNDVLIACPGLTYRRDSIDRLHVGEPHQLDLWRVKRGRLKREDLVTMTETVVGALLPGAALKLNPTVHPYTLEGLEVYARVSDAWVEVLECGLAHPDVLGAAGLHAEDYSGLAMGMGLDRLLMLRKGIDDIRILRSTDERIQRQMLDLKPYRAVSAQPAIQRDLSIAVNASLTAEELGDRVRTVLGDACKKVEEIAVVSESPYLELSTGARQRLGMSPHHKNVLLRLVIRDLERTLTSDEANVLRDEVYAAIHEGSVKSWAAQDRPRLVRRW
jgi:phenylalanyl-tRNA synthetase alpha chain